jgi:hypothetical protein
MPPSARWGQNTAYDVPNVGRYIIRPRKKGFPEWELVLNDKPLKQYGTIDELKRIIEKAINPQ